MLIIPKRSGVAVADGSVVKERLRTLGSEVLGMGLE